MSKHSLLERFWEITVAIGAALGVESFVHSLKKEGATAVVTAVKKKLTDEGRAELLAFLMVDLANYDERASKNILRRLAECNAKPEGDNKIVTLLGKLYISLSDTEREKATRLQSFRILGRMKDKRFYNALEALNHDYVMRLIKRLPDITEEVFNGFVSTLTKLGIFTALQATDAFAAGKLKELNDNLEKHWWVRLSNKKGIRWSLALMALLLVPVILLFTL